MQYQYELRNSRLQRDMLGQAHVRVQLKIYLVNKNYTDIDFSLKSGYLLLNKN